MFADIEGDVVDILKTDAPEIVPVLATRNMVIFPGVLVPILLGRKPSMALARWMNKNEKNNVCAIFCQKKIDIDTPRERDMFNVGVYARLVRIIEMPSSDNITAIFQATGRCQLDSLTTLRPFYKGHVTALPEDIPDNDDEEFKTIVSNIRTVTQQFIQLSDEIPDETIMTVRNLTNDVLLTNFVCTKLEELKNEIRRKTKIDLDEQQKEYFLQQQMKNIKEELGDKGANPERARLEEGAKKMDWPMSVAQHFAKEMERLDTYNPQSPEYSVQVNYLEQMLALPWNKSTRDNLDIKHAKHVLDEDHYGMEKVKERILEYLAVLQLRGNMKSPILCLVGPPGVGKTSLGKSIANAMHRNYVRISLGGVHDESEIRGHRRTYVGAMPGRIIKSMQKAGASNPVFILDEIDKVTQNTINGDPSSALLEVLDPEQNSTFHDNYLDIDYDLSKILFIATANELNTIPAPLLDRMEIIDVSGYITEEKIEIAKRHLIPKELINTGLDKVKPKVRFNKATLEKIIESYTRESGVRQLEKQINKALRKIAFNKAVEDSFPQKAITPSEVTTLLGKPPYYRDIYQGNEYAGIVTGLAWTSVGGEILFIETSLSKGAAGKLTLTGNLGDVMKESAIIALQYVKAHCENLGIDYRIFENYNIHIHVPEGATPKDGPSAGITIATSIASALTQRKVRKNTAMTGEITLRGKVLPVGGIKEKILAAKRAGITDILMCKDNRKDIDEIPEKYLQGVTFHYVENIQDVWDFALTDEIVSHPVHYTIDKKEDKVQ